MIQENSLALKPFFKPISVAALNRLGYELTGREIGFGNYKAKKISILEVKYEDSRNKVNFCYAYSMANQIGVILPQSFDYYQKNPILANF